MSKVFSKFTVKIDGTVVLAKEGAAFDPGGVERQTQKSMSRVDGYSEAPKESSLEIDINLLRGMSLTDLNNLTDATIVLEADTGQTWVMRNAWSANPATVTGGSSAGGKVTFNAPPAEEIL